MKRYTVEYKEYSAGEVKSIDTMANSKQDAYDKVVFEELDIHPYSAWVASVTYQNGKCKSFNTFEGNPF